MAINTEQLIKRHGRMKAEHQEWCFVWQQLADFMSPRKSNFEVQRSQGAKQTEKLYDSTALKAADRLASLMNGTLTSRAIDWFSLKVRDGELNENHEVMLWLEESTKRMLRSFNQSNFASEAHEIYLDLDTLGTACMFVEERNPSSTQFEGFVFTSLPLANITIAEDKEGRVNTVFHEFKFTVAQAVEKWGKDKLGEKMTRALDEGKIDVEFTFLHAMYPRMVDVEMMPKKSTPNTRLPWVDAYVCIEDKQLMFEGGFHEFPCMVPRWSKTAGERYGRGPGHIALPDTKTLNKAVEIGLKTWAKNLNMPMKAKAESVQGAIRNKEGGVTIMNDINNIEPLYPPGSFRESITNDQIKGAELRDSIRSIFYADQMQLPEGIQMTATEVLKRMELIYRVLGPTVGRFEAEFLNPLIYRTFGIAYRRGALDKAPDILLKSGKLDIEYEGPLAKAQKLAHVEATERWLGIIASATQVFPDLPDNVNSDEMIRSLGEDLGVPENFLQDPDVRDANRKQKQEQIAQQQKLADLQSVATAAGKATPAIKALSGASTSGNTVQ